ncbi:hypothetical protein HYU06_05655 [Candidatus Woesearchaeota archaeon]|nr:hypothetical protein [Candidatus Woesearchaeota archaeon]
MFLNKKSQPTVFILMAVAALAMFELIYATISEILNSGITAACYEAVTNLKK